MSNHVVNLFTNYHLFYKYKMIEFTKHQKGEKNMKKTFKFIVSALCLSAVLVGGTSISADASRCGGANEVSKPCYDTP